MYIIVLAVLFSVLTVTIFSDYSNNEVNYIGLKNILMYSQVDILNQFISSYNLQHFSFYSIHPYSSYNSTSNPLLDIAILTATHLDLVSTHLDLVSTHLNSVSQSTEINYWIRSTNCIVSTYLQKIENLKGFIYSVYQTDLPLFVRYQNYHGNLADILSCTINSNVYSLDDVLGMLPPNIGNLDIYDLDTYINLLETKRELINEYISNYILIGIEHYNYNRFNVLHIIWDDYIVNGGLSRTTWYTTRTITEVPRYLLYWMFSSTNFINEFYHFIRTDPFVIILWPREIKDILDLLEVHKLQFQMLGQFNSTYVDLFQEDPYDIFSKSKWMFDEVGQQIEDIFSESNWMFDEENNIQENNQEEIEDIYSDSKWMFDEENNLENVEHRNTSEDQNIPEDPNTSENQNTSEDQNTYEDQNTLNQNTQNQNTSEGVEDIYSDSKWMFDEEK